MNEILKLVGKYEERLCGDGIPKIPMEINRKFSELSRRERLAHAHFLCDSVKMLATYPDQRDRVNRLLSLIQACLGFAGLYTERDLQQDRMTLH